MSFFDEFEPVQKNYKLYKEISFENSINYQKRILYEEELTIKSGKGIYKTRYFKLQDRKLLLFSKKGSVTPHGYFDLVSFVTISLMEITNKKDRYFFRLSKFNKVYDFFSSDQKKIKNWYLFLKLYCLSDGFDSHFEKLETLGKGHFAHVYKVRHKPSGELYAAKVINKNMPVSNKELIYNEIKLVRLLPKHENILKMYEIFEEKNEIILILELMNGGDLYQFIRKNYDSNEKKVCFLFIQILKAVKFLHCNGVAHRDIKPENLLLSDKTDYPLVKLADFSLADNFLEKKMTLQCGTPGYIAPEIFNDGAIYDQTVDIFSLGITLFMMLTGSSPFKCKEAKGILELNKYCFIKYKKNKWSKISKDARKLVVKMLSKNPQARIPLSTILIDKWLKTNDFSSAEKNNIYLKYNSPTKEKVYETEKTFSKEELTEKKVIGTITQGKLLSLSTRGVTSKSKLSFCTPPNHEQMNKISNTVNSIFLNSETSLMGSQASCSNNSKESSLELPTKRSNFNTSEKLNPIHHSCDEIDTNNSHKHNKNKSVLWMISGTDHILTHTRSIIQTQNSNMMELSNAWMNHDEENVVKSEEKTKLKKRMKYLIANGVNPKFLKLYK